MAALSLVCLPVFAQQFSLQPVAPAAADAKLLATHVDDYQYLSFDRPLSTRVRAQTPTLFLPGPGGTELELVLHPVDLYGAQATIRLLTPTGEQRLPAPRDITYRGYVRGQPDRRVSLLVDGDYVYGSITDGTQRSYLVSASVLLPGAPVDRYLLYDQADRLVTKSAAEGVQCGTDAPFVKSVAPGGLERKSAAGECYEVRLGVASDYLLYADKGSVQAVIDHVVGVLLSVETDYQLDDFSDQLLFDIREQVISTCADCDPWTDAESSSALLDDFDRWTQGGGFRQDPAMAQLWSDRDFDGPGKGTVGLANLGNDLLCSGSANHVLQDYTSDPDGLRVLTSHEIGHNLNAGHDNSGGFIMSPTINNTTAWSSASVSVIDGSVDRARSSGCLPLCSAVADCSPVVDLEATAVTATGFDLRWSAPDPDATTYRIRVFADETGTELPLSDELYGTTDPGAINPAGWQPCTRYRISVENMCSDGFYSTPVTVLVNYTAAGCADFVADTTVAWEAFDVQFTDLSINASSWSWDFGDGNTSTAQHPLHRYTAPGHYTVALTVNGVDTDRRTSFIAVLPAGTAAPYTAADGGDMESEDFVGVNLSGGDTSLFERGVPTSGAFAGVSTGNSWITRLAGDVPNATVRSAVYSPEFDLSSVLDPAIRFDLGMVRYYSNAPYAVQLQYSTDRGGSWTRLGSSEDADWYNKGPADASPIFTSVFADQTGWLLANERTTFSYDLTSLGSPASVVFRFVFSMVGGLPELAYRDGALLDNVALSGTSDIAAPVDLLSFSGQCQDDRVNLHWQTATETDNAHFLIERRRADDGTFELLEKVAGAGNSQVVQDYRTTDPSPDYGINYYRLTQVDFDGTATVYDDLVAVEYAVDGPVTLYPNPVSGPVARLDVPTAAGGPLTIEVIDDGGRRVYRREVTARAYGNTFDLPVGEWPAGGYTVRVVYGGRVSVRRLVRVG